MTATTPTEGTHPLASPGGELFFDVNDSAWLVFLLERLAAGDVVCVDRNGDWLFFDRPGA